MFSVGMEKPSNILFKNVYTKSPFVEQSDLFGLLTSRPNVSGSPSPLLSFRLRSCAFEALRPWDTGGPENIPGHRRRVQPRADAARAGRAVVRYSLPGTDLS